METVWSFFIVDPPATVFDDAVAGDLPIGAGEDDADSVVPVSGIINSQQSRS